MNFIACGEPMKERVTVYDQDVWIHQCGRSWSYKYQVFSTCQKEEQYVWELVSILTVHFCNKSIQFKFETYEDDQTILHWVK